MIHTQQWLFSDTKFIEFSARASQIEICGVQKLNIYIQVHVKLLAILCSKKRRTFSQFGHYVKYQKLLLIGIIVTFRPDRPSYEISKIIVALYYCKSSANSAMISNIKNYYCFISLEAFG